MATLPAPFVFRRDPATGLECCPSREELARLTPTALAAVHDYLDVRLAAHLETQPGEGTAHSGAIAGACDRLRGHFERLGRGVFIAPNLGVHYPDAPPFAPDLLAVLDVALHDRRRWQVDTEGRGVDFVLEILVDGNRQKDLVDNVVFYASLGIPEYFVYTVRERSLKAWRLEPAAEVYTRIVPQFGRLLSRVLDLEFAVLEGELRCWRDGAELPLTRDLVSLLGRLVNEREAQVAESERARLESERARMAALRRDILRTLRLRGLEPTDAERARIEGCDAVDQLEVWDERVEDAPTVAALLE